MTKAGTVIVAAILPMIWSQFGREFFCFHLCQCEELVRRERVGLTDGGFAHRRIFAIQVFEQLVEHGHACIRCGLA
jgi:hypothetical protein